jgi:hypothetical protein
MDGAASAQVRYAGRDEESRWARVSEVCGDVVVPRNECPAGLTKCRGEGGDEGREREVGEGPTGGVGGYWPRGEHGRGVGKGRASWADRRSAIGGRNERSSARWGEARGG